MGIVIEPTMPCPDLRQHSRIQRFLARMAERGMADIVGETQRLGQVFVQAQRAGKDAADLRDFEAMSQAHPVMIAVRCDENLGLVAQTTERN